MIVIIVQGNRPLPRGKNINTKTAERLFKTMNSYAGTYTIKDNFIIHHVKVSWNQKWTDTDQIRYYKFNGTDYLILSMPPIIDPKNKTRTVDSLELEKIK